MTLLPTPVTLIIGTVSGRVISEASTNGTPNCALVATYLMWLLKLSLTFCILGLTLGVSYFYRFIMSS
ncbi:hypothetical protein EB796_007775 [Bugula neritina]|uniref:Uncharacterized protein n=1 Tax=Bugula neritina TaxID=10212 RepID=A0A7J7K6U9_BUGNE|nr:hypothetical protein EB796_007775 [Bugula neritina]